MTSTGRRWKRTREDNEKIAKQEKRSKRENKSGVVGERKRNANRQTIRC
jgi:hypothetical protein